MSLEWSDIFGKVIPVLTGLGGYFGRMLQSESRKKRMRNQLYREISDNYYIIWNRLRSSVTLEGIKNLAPLHFADNLDISLNVWRHYTSDTQREQFFELKEAQTIGRIYDKFVNIGNEERAGYSHVRGREAMAEIDDRLLDGGLSQKIYKKNSRPETWAWMKELFARKRNSYSVTLNSN